MITLVQKLYRVYYSTAGSLPSCLHPFALFPSSHRNVPHGPSYVDFAQIGLNHIWGILSSEKKNLVRGQLANLLNFSPEGMYYLCYLGRKMNLSSALEGNPTSIFKGCLLFKYPWKSGTKALKRCIEIPWSIILQHKYTAFLLIFFFFSF